MSKIIVALDFANWQEAQSVIVPLKRQLEWVKVGMQLFYSEGPSLIAKIKEQGFKVFLDIKVHDIPNTAKGAMSSISGLGVDMVNCHIAGGSKMMASALEGFRSQNANGLVIGVSQLTSTSEEMMNKELKILGRLEDCVMDYARLAKEAKLQGLVCSPHEVRRVKQELGADFITVVPGIRPKWASSQDQVRITSPREAQAMGADFLVIGRAITQSENVLLAFEKIQEELN